MSKSNFEDVGEFHQRFGLHASHWAAGQQTLSQELIDFRVKFLEEELAEIKEALATGDQAKLADGLIDLAYVTFGFAHLLGLPWQQLWDEVQRANMTKDRCHINHVYKPGTVDDGFCCHGLDESTVCGKSKAVHSVRGSANDVIKPEGWRPPDIEGVLRSYGWKL